MSEHKWSPDGERCEKCGTKDWIGGPCINEPLNSAERKEWVELKNILEVLKNEWPIAEIKLRVVVTDLLSERDKLAAELAEAGKRENDLRGERGDLQIQVKSAAVRNEELRGDIEAVIEGSAEWEYRAISAEKELAAAKAMIELQASQSTVIAALDSVTQERDAARAEVERLKAQWAEIKIVPVDEIHRHLRAQVTRLRVALERITGLEKGVSLHCNGRLGLPVGTEQEAQVEVEKLDWVFKKDNQK